MVVIGFKERILKGMYTVFNVKKNKICLPFVSEQPKQELDKVSFCPPPPPEEGSYALHVPSLGSTSLQRLRLL